jgi:hypothetical protein
MRKLIILYGSMIYMRASINKTEIKGTEKSLKDKKFAYYHEIEKFLNRGRNQYRPSLKSKYYEKFLILYINS